MNPRDPLLRAWGALIALTGLSTAAALLRPAAPRAAVLIAAGVILALAWLKARVILGAYLDLNGYPAARRGFAVVLAVWVIAALGLIAAAG